jgi:oxysterol-binding protein-related protein 8
VIQYPKSYIKGIFFGSSGIENSGELTIECPETGMKAIVNFKSGNMVEGTIKDSNNETLYQIKGSMKSKVVFLDVKENQEIEIQRPMKIEKIVAPVEKQKPNESRKVWYQVTRAILSGENEIAQKEKIKIEERQRKFLLEENHESVWFIKTDRNVQNVPIYDFNNKK